MLRRVTDLCFLKMPVNTVQYRVTVGIFNNRKLIKKIIYFNFPVVQYSSGRARVAMQLLNNT